MMCDFEEDFFEGVLKHSVVERDEYGVTISFPSKDFRLRGDDYSIERLFIGSDAKTAIKESSTGIYVCESQESASIRNKFKIFPDILSPSTVQSLVNEVISKSSGITREHLTGRVYTGSSIVDIEAYLDSLLSSGYVYSHRNRGPLVQYFRTRDHPDFPVVSKLDIPDLPGISVVKQFVEESLVSSKCDFVMRDEIKCMYTLDETLKNEFKSFNKFVKCLESVLGTEMRCDNRKNGKVYKLHGYRIKNDDDDLSE